MNVINQTMITFYSESVGLYKIELNAFQMLHFRLQIAALSSLTDTDEEFVNEEHLFPALNTVTCVNNTQPEGANELKPLTVKQASPKMIEQHPDESLQRESLDCSGGPITISGVKEQTPLAGQINHPQQVNNSAVKRS